MAAPGAASRKPPPRSSTGFFGADEAYGFGLLFSIVLVATALRVLVLSGNDYPLYGDEAQYWAWSRHLDWGYYSKPPLIAWLIRLGTLWLGDSEFGVRALSPFLHGGTALLLYLIGRRLYDARIGFWSALVYASLPAVSLSSLLMSTDVPLLFFWALGLYCYLRANEAAGARRWWVGVGLAIGLGTLSKYSMALFVPSMLLHLWVARRDLLRTAPPWLAIALGFVLILPNIVWNAANGFVSYLHTADNANLHGSLLHPGKLLEFLGAQLGVFGPALFLILLGLLLFRFRGLLRDQKRWLLTAFILPQLALALAIAFMSRANANWAAPIYVSGTVLVTGWAFAEGAAARWRRGLLIGSVVFHALIGGGIYAFHDIAHAMGIELTAKTDPFRRLMGGRKLGRAVQAILEQQPAPVLMSDDRMLHAELLYYLPGHPPAVEWSEDGKVHDEFQLEADARQFRDVPILLVSRDEHPAALAHYAEAEPVSVITIPLYPDLTLRYHLFRLRGLKQ
jgi:hypothetical protein